MNKEKSKNYTFDNDLIIYQSYVNEFTYKNFKELDLKAKEVDLNSKIENLINGDIVNQTENQAAFHPIYRMHQAKDEGSIPDNLYQANYIAMNFCEKWKKQSENCKSNEIINIITLGIGGSFEGPKLLLECFNYPLGYGDKEKAKMNFDFITGSDPKEFYFKTKNLDPKNTFFIVSSKSFTTDETIKNLQQALNWSPNKNNFIAITSKPEEAKKYGISEVITFDKEIGGRYSIWSPITQFHLCDDKDSLLKENIKKRKNFFKGGFQADKDILNDIKYQEFVKRLSFTDIWLNNMKGINSRVILSYDWDLRSLPYYLQQLEMESLGKQANLNSEFKNTGQIIFGGYGPTAQHSYFQLLHQGTQRISADIILSKEDSKSLAYAQAITQSKLLANTSKDLKEEEKINGNVPVNLFLIDKLDPYSLGYLIATWEYRVFITATILGINPFDQFGVNAGKIYTKQYLADKD